MLGSIGTTEIVIVLVIVLFIFGPKRLPEFGRSIGETIKQFKWAGKQLTEEEDPDDDPK